jgi:hypothetical protein
VDTTAQTTVEAAQSSGFFEALDGVRLGLGPAQSISVWLRVRDDSDWALAIGEPSGDGAWALCEVVRCDDAELQRVAGALWLQARALTERWAELESAAFWNGLRYRDA